MAYTSQYPTQDANHVKATSTLTGDFVPYFATDPAKSLIDGWTGNAWLTASGVTASRFHIDLGAGFIIKRVYIENAHTSGSNGEYGVKDFTFWGSNTGAAFAELTYATDTNWTQLTTSPTQVAQHSASNSADAQYFTVTNTTSYQYYAVKFANSWGGAFFGTRRIVLQTEDASPASTVVESTANHPIKFLS